MTRVPRIALISSGNAPSPCILSELALSKMSSVEYSAIRQEDFKERHLNEFDLFWGQHRFSSEEFESLISSIHPNRTINCRIQTTKKTSIAESYTRIFGNPLMVYRKDLRKFECEKDQVFRKSEHHTCIGRYSSEPLPIFDCELEMVNQIFVGDGASVYSACFFDKHPFFVYRLMTEEKDQKAVKDVNACEIDYYDGVEKTCLLKPWWNQACEMMRDCGVEFGRIDFVFQDGEPYILDVNPKPFAATKLPDWRKKINGQLVSDQEVQVFADKCFLSIEANLIQRSKETPL